MMKFMNKRRKNNQKGFTLIELIVVIAIIGILAGMLLPRFGNFTTEARNARADSDVRGFASIVEVYRARHGSTPSIGLTGSTATIIYDATAETVSLSDPTNAGAATISDVTGFTVKSGSTDVTLANTGTGNTTWTEFTVTINTGTGGSTNNIIRTYDSNTGSIK